MSLLAGFKVAQVGPGHAAAVCGRLFCDAGAEVTTIDASTDSLFLAYLNGGKRIVVDAAEAAAAIAEANLIVSEGAPAVLRARGHDAKGMRRSNPTATIVQISSFGQTGPDAEMPATDLTLFFESGIARLLTGQVDDLSEPPVPAVGCQSAFIGGVVAACAGMQASLSSGDPAIIDISLQEALATLAITELARGGLSGKSWSRKRLKDGNGATVTILPASDGYVAISPRETRQWAAWLGVMGEPDWGGDPRFATKADRIENWDALYRLMSDWSRRYDKQWIADTAQAAHVPSFPLRELEEHLSSPQLESRRFFRSLNIDGDEVKAPGAPFNLTIPDGRRRPVAQPPSTSSLPLAGVRVLDFSWVIAGPTATRHIAAMGAEIIKVEAPGRADPGRASELHTVLGQAKRGITLDLKKKSAVEVAKALAARSDVVIENFATGVMERLGLGASELRALNPDLIYLSASGMGRTGPDSQAVAYGTLLQSYAGFAGLNRHPDRPPRVGFAWLDPMCGLMLPFVAAAALWRRSRTGGGVRIDFSMIEAMLWTMAKPLLEMQCGMPARPLGTGSPDHAPHGVYRCLGADEWLSIVVTDDDQWRALCASVPDLETALGPDGPGLDLEKRRSRSSEIDAVLSAWAGSRNAHDAAQSLKGCGVPAAALADSIALVNSQHLRARGFWDRQGDGVLPGLPWQADFGRQCFPAPALGADTETVLRNVLGMSEEEISALRAGGALG